MKLFTILYCLLFTTVSSILSPKLSIEGNKFLLDNQYINFNSPAEGILINSLMVQGISDDVKHWDASINNYEFVSNMSVWKSYGLNAFTIGLQGGAPEKYKNSAFTSDGSLKDEYMNRLKLILDEASKLKMIVIVSLFYKTQVNIFKGYPQVLDATLNVIHWLQKGNYTNIIIEPVNECEYSEFKKVGLGCHQHITDLIELVQIFKFPAGSSYKVNNVPSEKIVNASEVILLHGNDFKKQLDAVKNLSTYRGQPIVYNKATTDYKQLIWCVQNEVGFGYYDESGFQIQPINWSVNNTKSKRDFFDETKRLTTPQYKPKLS
jgi:hypothetical protein